MTTGVSHHGMDPRPSDLLEAEDDELRLSLPRHASLMFANQSSVLNCFSLPCNAAPLAGGVATATSPSSVIYMDRG